MKRAANSADRRSGVILIVVLALLTLLSITGITFVLVADADRPGSRAFQRDIESLVGDTRDLAFFLSPLLIDDLDDVDDEGVYSGVSGALGRLSARAAEIRLRVQEAYDQTEDRAARADLRRLERRLESYQDLVCQLRKYLELIIRLT